MLSLRRGARVVHPLFERDFGYVLCIGSEGVRYGPYFNSNLVINLRLPAAPAPAFHRAIDTGTREEVLSQAVFLPVSQLSGHQSARNQVLRLLRRGEGQAL